MQEGDSFCVLYVDFGSVWSKSTCTICRYFNTLHAFHQSSALIIGRDITDSTDHFENFANLTLCAAATNNAIGIAVNMNCLD